jgi:hypothetical protein
VDITVFGPQEAASVGELLGTVEPACTDAGVEPYDDGLYVGQAQYWTQCDGVPAEVVVIAAAPAGKEYAIRVIAQVATQADLEALNEIVATFEVTA